MIQTDLEEQVVKLTEFINSHHYGKYIGKVKQVGQESNFGCIKANIPEIYGDIDSPWIKPCVPLAGFIMLPNLDDLVWIEFEAGDISRPIWTGFVWAKDENPTSIECTQRIIMTPNGHKILIDDDKNGLCLVHSNNCEIKITEDEIILKNGNSQIAIKSDQVNINDGALVVKAPTIFKRNR